MEKQAISSGLTQSEKKRIRSLLTKKGRKKEGQFIAEGIRLLEESFRFGRRPQMIYYSPALLNSRARDLIAAFKRGDAPLRAISSRALRQISDTESTQGILGVFDIPQVQFNDLLEQKYGRLLLLDNISDPGNAGVLMRSACAFGFEVVLMLESSTEPFSPKVVRSSAGTFFGLKIASISVEDLLRIKRAQGYSLVIADLKGEELGPGIKNIRPGKSVILAVGSESAGLSEEIRKAADIRLRIGHSDRVESLNAAVAGSIIMKVLYDRPVRREKR
jgi:TrmH family RNA methyltransferase